MSQKAMTGRYGNKAKIDRCRFSLRWMTKSQTIDTTDGSIEQLILSQVETLEQAFEHIPARVVQEILPFEGWGCFKSLLQCSWTAIYPCIQSINLSNQSSQTLRFQHVGSTGGVCPEF